MTDSRKLQLISELLEDLRTDPITVGEIYDLIENSVKSGDLSNISSQIAELCAVIQCIHEIVEGE